MRPTCSVYDAIAPVSPDDGGRGAAARAAARRALGALARACAGSWLHGVWFANIAAVGLVFVSHPQKTPSLAAQHALIGTCLIVGAHFLALERRAPLADTARVWRTPFAPCAADAVPHDGMVAAACFGVAAVVLVRFDDDFEEVHHGVAPQCHAGWPVALAAYALAAASALGAPLLALALAGADSGGGARAAAKAAQSPSSQPPPRAGAASAAAHGRRRLAGDGGSGVELSEAPPDAATSAFEDSSESSEEDTEDDDDDEALLGGES